jgi:hypothetical protein
VKSLPIGRLAQDRVADVAAQREQVAEHLLADLRRARLGAGEVVAAERVLGRRALNSPVASDRNRALARGSRMTV